MKANELMIGDWVLINGTPRKIQAVNGVDDEIMADDELYTLAEDRYHSEDKVEGVPLTPEILEKNRIKRTGISEFSVKKKDYEISLDFDLIEREKPLQHRFWYSIKKNNPIDGLMPLHYSEGYYSYVHELLRVLRLCGIEKEIEL